MSRNPSNITCIRSNTGFMPHGRLNWTAKYNICSSNTAARMPYLLLHLVSELSIVEEVKWTKDGKNESTNQPCGLQEGNALHNSWTFMQVNRIQKQLQHKINSNVMPSYRWRIKELLDSLDWVYYVQCAHEAPHNHAWYQQKTALWLQKFVSDPTEDCYYWSFWCDA